MSEHVHFNRKMREIRERYGLTKLQLVGDDDRKEQPLTLQEAARLRDREEQRREGHLAFGHAWSPIDGGKPVRLYYSIRY